MVKCCANSLVYIVGISKQKMICSGIWHYDETGIRADKKRLWVYITSNGEYTYLDMRSRGTSMKQCYVLTEFQGISMHDYWDIVGITLEYSI